MRQMTATANPKVQEFLTLLKDPEVYSVFKGLVTQVLTDPDVLVLKRLTNIERHLGADDDWCVWEDSTKEGREVLMPIAEAFDLISGRIEDASLPVHKETVFAGNDTEIRAGLLKKKLSECDMRNGKRFMISREVQRFLLSSEVPEKYRVDGGKSSARKAAYDVMNKAYEMYPNDLVLTKNRKNVNVIEFLEKR